MDLLFLKKKKSEVGLCLLEAGETCKEARARLMRVGWGRSESEMTKPQAERVCTGKTRLIKETANCCGGRLPVQFSSKEGALAWAGGFGSLNPQSAGSSALGLK